jgi:thiamine-monophosphate kinase
VGLIERDDPGAGLIPQQDDPNMQLVRDIGEFHLIDRLRGILPDEVRAGPGIRLGIGDDAALVDLPAGESMVVTTDAMVEGVHFRLDWTDWRSLGHKLLAVNLSDLAAMGATPRIATITLGLTGNEYVEDLVAMYEGIGALASQTGVVIAGGDIVRNPNGLNLDLTAIGSVAPERAIRRDGANPGDLIVVSGTLGAAAAGMALLECGDRGARTSGLLINAHLRPEPRIALGSLLHEAGVSAGMDLSDGLYGDLDKLLGRSAVAAELDASQIPVAAAVRALFPDRWFEMATRGGEDYELLLTIPENRFPDLQAAAAEVGSTMTAIGRIIDGTAGAIVAIEADGTRTPVATGAFDHFA